MKGISVLLYISAIFFCSVTLAQTHENLDHNPDIYNTKLGCLGCHQGPSTLEDEEVENFQNEKIQKEKITSSQK